MSAATRAGGYRVVEELIAVAGELLQEIDAAGNLVADEDRARAFCRRLLKIGHAIATAPRPPKTAEVIDLPLRRALRGALARPGDGDVA